MIIIAGHLRVAPAERGHYLELASTATALARTTPGCLDFVQAADPLEADRIVIYERWESDEQLDAFRSLPGDDDVELPAIVSAQVSRFRIAAVEPA